MTAGADITLGELGRIVVTIGGDLREFRGEFNKKMESLDTTYVRADLYDEKVNALNLRIAKLEATQSWLARTVAVTGISVVTGAIVALLRFTGNG